MSFFPKGSRFLLSFMSVLTANSWSTYPSAYTTSKAALGAYSRILAKKFLTFCINCVCPGYTKTDLNYNTGILIVEEGAKSVVRLALLPNGGPFWSNLYPARSVGPLIAKFSLIYLK